MCSTRLGSYLESRFEGERKGVKLLSINVSQPVSVEADGQRVTTSIFKKAVAGPVRVTFLNLEGDRQSNLKVHGGLDKAVYVYSWTNLEHWRRALQREDLGPGSFGENLTVEGLADDEISIGDELEIGTARFLVTQPRLPCFKLGIALGDPEFPKVFHRSGRNGFYLRVLKEGSLNAGGELRKLESAARHRMTIAEFVKVAARRTPTKEELDRILQLAALPDSWKKSLARKHSIRVGA